MYSEGKHIQQTGFLSIVDRHVATLQFSSRKEMKAESLSNETGVGEKSGQRLITSLGIWPGKEG